MEGDMPSVLDIEDQYFGTEVKIIVLDGILSLNLALYTLEANIY